MPGVWQELLDNGEDTPLPTLRQGTLQQVLRPRSAHHQIWREQTRKGVQGLFRRPEDRRQIEEFRFFRLRPRD